MKTARKSASALPLDIERPRVLEEFKKIRHSTLELCTPLEPEDHVIQTMPDVSPPKWHLAHTTWFFENFILLPHRPDYAVFRDKYDYLFNSYYKTVGPHQPRPLRGMLSRPPLQEIKDYRLYVDEQMTRLIEECESSLWNQARDLIVLGLNHEQQHQELLLTDIKHIFFCNPLRPVYRPSVIKPRGRARGPAPTVRNVEWVAYPEGIREIGFSGKGFSFDNERPRHRVYLESFSLASRLVTNREYLEFVQDGGYREPRLWLSDGWDRVLQERWTSPLYWEPGEAAWTQWTLLGQETIDPEEPVCHVSYYEADAFARWAGERLPTEAEWEVAAAQMPIDGNFLETGLQKPISSSLEMSGALRQMFGDVWEWTRSPYSPYPRYKAESGNLGEYNGKFMCNQMVLRGGSCLTPATHIRPTYRNFFPPHARWQCTGIRLAKGP